MKRLSNIQISPYLSTKCKGLTSSREESVKNREDDKSSGGMYAEHGKDQASSDRCAYNQQVERAEFLRYVCQLGGWELKSWELTSAMKLGIVRPKMDAAFRIAS